MAMAISAVSRGLGEPQRQYLAAVKIMRLPGIIGLLVPVVQTIGGGLGLDIASGVGKSHVLAKGISALANLSQLIAKLIAAGHPFGASFLQYLTSMVCLSLTSLVMGDIDLYCMKPFIPGRKVGVVKARMFGGYMQYTAAETSVKEKKLTFLVDEFGFTRLFFSLAKDMTGTNGFGFQAQKMQDALVALLRSKGYKAPKASDSKESKAAEAAEKAGEMAGKAKAHFNNKQGKAGSSMITRGAGAKIVDMLTAPTFDILVMSVGVDKKTVTDGTLLHSVQVVGVDDLDFDKGSQQKSPLTLGVDIVWDSQEDVAGSAAWLLGKVMPRGLVGLSPNYTKDWSTDGKPKEAR